MSNKDPDQRLTPAERARIVERHFQAMEWKHLLEDYNLALLLKHSAALRARGGAS